MQIRGVEKRWVYFNPRVKSRKSNTAAIQYHRQRQKPEQSKNQSQKHEQGCKKDRQRIVWQKQLNARCAGRQIQRGTGKLGVTDKVSEIFYKKQGYVKSATRNDVLRGTASRRQT